MENIIDGKTKIGGVIGYPIEHTVSPVIHNSLAQIYGHNLVYVPLPVAKDGLEAAIKGAEAFDFFGMNVTVPYKSEVIPFLQDIDSLAKSIGAVNTLVKVPGGYKGYNTDMPGLYRAMCSDGVDVQGKDVIILGAGGVARAVALLLLEKGATKIYILNRTLEKAQIIASEINEKAGQVLCMAMSLTDYQKLPKDCKYIAIQATNVGMYPHTGQAVIEEEAFYQMLEFGYDIVYNPMNTKFMQLVKNAGGKSFHGLKMLLYQGIIAYELWHQISISEDVATQVYEKMKRALQ